MPLLTPTDRAWFALATEVYTMGLVLFWGHVGEAFGVAD